MSHQIDISQFSRSYSLRSASDIHFRRRRNTRFAHMMVNSAIKRIAESSMGISRGIAEHYISRQGEPQWH